MSQRSYVALFLIVLIVFCMYLHSKFILVTVMQIMIEPETQVQIQANPNPSKGFGISFGQFIGALVLYIACLSLFPPSVAVSLTALIVLAAINHDTAINGPTGIIATLKGTNPIVDAVNSYQKINASSANIGTTPTTPATGNGGLTGAIPNKTS